VSSDEKVLRKGGSSVENFCRVVIEVIMMRELELN